MESPRQSTDKHPRIDSEGVRYRFSPGRRITALAFIWLGLGCSAISILVYLNWDPDEGIYGIYAALCSATLGVVTLYYGLRDLMGHLTVDEAGVRVWPSGFGPSLDWRSIERWRVKTPKEGTDEEFETCLVIALRGRRRSRRIPASMAHRPGFDQLVEEFRRHAGSREEVELAEPGAAADGGGV